MLLTLDISTHTGWTIGPIADTLDFKFGTEHLPATGDDVGRYIDAFDEWLDRVLKEHKPSIVVFEAPILPRQTSLMTLRKLNSIIGHTEWVCHYDKIDCFELHLQSVKKFWTGKGNATKPDMIATAKRYGFDVGNDDNQADAIALRALALFKIKPEFAARFQLGALGAAAAGQQ